MRIIKEEGLREMEITRRAEGTTIKLPFSLGASKIECFIGTAPTGNNSQARFILNISEGGQVDEGCNLSFCGPIEQGEFRDFLNQLIIELDLINIKDENSQNF